MEMTISQTMSSREIAELSGKEHRNVLSDCDKLNEFYRKMGLAEISAGVYTHPNTGSQQHREYQLTKMQTFDLMTGYNTELRIKVNRRWEELETKTQQVDFNNPATVLQLAQKWYDAENRAKMLEETNRLQENTLKQQAPKVEYHDKVMASGSLITATEIANELGFSSAKAFNQRLKEMGILRKVNDTWALRADCSGKGYAQYKPHPYIDSNGKEQTSHHLYWTEEGRKFLNTHLQNIIRK